ncbi:MAG: DUF2914 domain-containing protein [Desulfobacterales bacterium]|nr:DUF2914 domain-containing protein [Desulfobacterales bacterium]MDJ0913880.1 DUF2914 domain-containing protein [Desulfobacterales bacterium]
MLKKVICGLIGLSLFAVPAFGLEQKTKQATNDPLRLAAAMMCERVKSCSPDRQAVVFSTEIGEVSCFTTFDKVTHSTFIFHKWYKRDRISTKIRLNLKPPQWSTFSSIRLREADKGPWRVEITDSQGKIFKILRFSITD